MKRALLVVLMVVISHGALALEISKCESLVQQRLEADGHNTRVVTKKVQSLINELVAMCEIKEVTRQIKGKDWAKVCPKISPINRSHCLRDWISQRKYRSSEEMTMIGDLSFLVSAIDQENGTNSQVSKLQMAENSLLVLETSRTQDPEVLRNVRSTLSALSSGKRKRVPSDEDEAWIASMLPGVVKRLQAVITNFQDDHRANIQE